MSAGEAPSAQRAEPDGLLWLIRFRWLTLAAQALALGTTMMSSTAPAPLAPLALLALVGASNATLALLRRRIAPSIGSVLIADTLVLTALLHATGGPMNPFTALYFVFITMAAVLLSTRWVLGILSLSLLACSSSRAAPPTPTRTTTPRTCAGCGSRSGCRPRS